MQKAGLEVSIYPTSCGVAFIIGWDPIAITIMLGPLHVSWLSKDIDDAT